MDKRRLNFDGLDGALDAMRGRPNFDRILAVAWRRWTEACTPEELDQLRLHLAERGIAAPDERGAVAYEARFEVVA